MDSTGPGGRREEDYRKWWDVIRVDLEEKLIINWKHKDTDKE